MRRNDNVVPPGHGHLGLENMQSLQNLILCLFVLYGNTTLTMFLKQELTTPVANGTEDESVPKAFMIKEYENVATKVYQRMGIEGRKIPSQAVLGLPQPRNPSTLAFDILYHTVLIRAGLNERWHVLRELNVLLAIGPYNLPISNGSFSRIGKEVSDFVVVPQIHPGFVIAIPMDFDVWLLTLAHVQAFA
ncbi:hypothetical protein Tco_1439925 [Tanacetum coccineum]